MEPIKSVLRTIPIIELDEQAQADLQEDDSDIEILLNNSIIASGVSK